MSGCQRGQLLALPHRTRHGVDKVERHLPENLRVAVPHEIDEPDRDVELEVRGKDGDTDRPRPGFDRLQEPVCTID